MTTATIPANHMDPVIQEKGVSKLNTVLDNIVNQLENGHHVDHTDILHEQYMISIQVHSDESYRAHYINARILFFNTQEEIVEDRFVINPVFSLLDDKEQNRIDITSLVRLAVLLGYEHGASGKYQLPHGEITYHNDTLTVYRGELCLDNNVIVVCLKEDASSQTKEYTFRGYKQNSPSSMIVELKETLPFRA